MDLTTWKLADQMCWSLGLLFGLMAGYIDLRADEVQGPVLLILIFATFLGFLNPASPWRWALIVGIGIPLTHFTGRAIGFYPHYPVLPNVFATFIALIPAFIGAYAGMLLRNIVAR
jgi:hypothetical protein